MKPILRRATPADLTALQAIEDESFSRPHWQRNDFLRFETTVAEVSNQIAGFLVARQTFRGAENLPEEREILNVATASQFRRQGIATTLLEHEMQRSATWFLEVRDSNQAAQNLYRKLGFAEISRRPKYYQNPEETAIVMRLKRC